MTERQKAALRPIKAEFARIVNKFKPYNSLHEALGVLLEEVDEFQREVFKSSAKHPDRMKLALEEIVQVGAIAARILHDFGGSNVK